MKVECPICGIMCFDNCVDEEKEMAQHMRNSHGCESLKCELGIKMTKVYVCLQTPHGDFGELGEYVFFKEHDAQNFCDDINKGIKDKGCACYWYYEECELK